MTWSPSPNPAPLNAGVPGRSPEGTPTGRLGAAHRSARNTE